MLQIVSGKFFQPGSERYVHQGKGILYSNTSWIAPIETRAGSLEPVHYLQHVSSFVLSYTNQIEKVGTLVRTGDVEIVDQFALLAMLGLSGYFAVSQQEVEYVCRLAPLNSGDQFLPSAFLPSFLASRKSLTKEATESFASLVERAIALPRRDYLQLITGLTTIRSAVRTISYDIDGAYALLVYCLESLAQRSDMYAPGWQDYNETVARRVDKVLTDVPDQIAAKIREALLTDANLRLRKRLIEFVKGRIGRAFYLGEAANIKDAIRPSQLERALRNAYDLRSGYVHQCRPILDHLRTPSIAGGETWVWQGEPYFTVAGLLRLVFHVLRNQLLRSSAVEREEIDWQNELPGVVLFELAPKYWVARTGTFRPAEAKKRFRGFLDELQSAFLHDTPVTDLRDFLRLIESQLSHADQSDKQAMLAMYWLYNHTVKAEGRLPGWEETLRKHASTLEVCSVPGLVSHLLAGKSPPWDLPKCLAVWERHCEQRYWKEEMDVPQAFEILILAELASLALTAKDAGQFGSLIERAILEAAGRKETQAVLCACGERYTSPDSDDLLAAMRKDAERTTARAPSPTPA